jgi:hypothetical protein
VEHIQPLSRSFPWRTAGLAAGLLLAAALLAAAGLALVHRQASTHPAATRSGVPNAKTPAIPLRPRSRVSVLVLNGDGITGAAGTEAQKLLSAGYRHAVPTDALQPFATSLVLFRRGWEREAHRLARETGIRTVTPLDGSLAPSYGGYQLVVILGSN